MTYLAALFEEISANHDNVGDDSNYFTALLGWWFTDKLLGTIGVGRESDADATFFQAGAAFVF
jgi:hypothetical protein